MNKSHVIRKKKKKFQTLYIWILEMHRQKGINRNRTHVATIGFHASSAKKTYNAEQKLLLWCLVNAGLLQHISVNTEQVGEEKSCVSMFVDDIWADGREEENAQHRNCGFLNKLHNLILIALVTSYMNSHCRWHNIYSHSFKLMQTI